MAFPFSKSRSLLTSCLHLKLQLLPSVSTLHSEYCQPLLTCLHVCTWNFSKLYNTPPAFKTQIDTISAGQEESVPRSSIHPGGSCDILRSIILKLLVVMTYFIPSAGNQINAAYRIASQQQTFVNTESRRCIINLCSLHLWSISLNS